jgi:hypothetical protein
VWLVNGWIRVARALGLQGKCRINVHPEAERERERERASPKMAVRLSCSPVTQRSLVMLQHVICPHVISNSRDILHQHVLQTGDNAETFTVAFLLNIVLSSRNQTGQ